MIRSATIWRWRRRRWPWPSRRQLQRLGTITLCAVCFVDMLAMSLTFIGESEITSLAGVQSTQRSECSGQVIVREDRAASIIGSLLDHSASLRHSNVVVVGWKSTDAFDTVVQTLAPDSNDVTRYDVSQADIRQWTNSDVRARFRISENDFCRFDIDAQVSSLSLDDFRFIFVLGSRDLAAATSDGGHNSRQIGRLLTQLVCLYESLKTAAKAHITLVSIFQEDHVTSPKRIDKLTAAAAANGGTRRLVTVANLTSITTRPCLWQPHVTSIYDTVLDIVFDLSLTYVHLYQFDFRIVAEHDIIL